MKVTIDMDKIKSHVGLDGQINDEVLGKILTNELILIQENNSSDDQISLVCSICGYIGLTLLGIDADEQMLKVKKEKEEENDG